MKLTKYPLRDQTIRKTQMYHRCVQRQRRYEAFCTAVTQALQVAVIEPASSELDNEPDLTICWVCFILPKPMNMSTVK